MKLIIQGERIAATATDEYTGPEAWIKAPEDSNIERLGEYCYIDGVIVLPVAGPPEVVARWQCIRALRLTADPNAPAGTCLQTMQALRDAMEPGNMRDDLDDALVNVLNWRRASPTLATVAAFAGWDAKFIDYLFREAAGYDL